MAFSVPDYSALFWTLLNDNCIKMQCEKVQCPKGLGSSGYSQIQPNVAILVTWIIWPSGAPVGPSRSQQDCD